MTANERIKQMQSQWSLLREAGRHVAAITVRNNVQLLTAIEWHRMTTRKWKTR